MTTQINNLSYRSALNPLYLKERHCCSKGPNPVVELPSQIAILTSETALKSQLTELCGGLGITAHFISPTEQVPEQAEAVLFAGIPLQPMQQLGTDPQHRPWLVLVDKTDGASCWLDQGVVGILPISMLSADTLALQLYQARLIHSKNFVVSQSDPLTGLLNFNAFQVAVKQAVDEVASRGRMMAVMSLDIRDFNRINRQHGYDFGDRVLAMFAHRLEREVGQYSTLGRLGGDEFLLLLQNVVDLHTLNVLTARIQKAGEAPFKVDEQQLHLDIAIGQVIYPEVQESPEGLVRLAHESLQQAKSSQRSLVCFHNDSAPIPETRLEMEMIHALRNQDFKLVYQPKVDLATRKVVGVEALIRWHHPKHGLISPGEFVQAAERSGFIVPLGLWIIEQACTDILELKHHGLGHLIVAVNISFVQLKHNRFGYHLTDLIQRMGVEAKNLQLELTETAVLENYDKALRILQSVNSWGVGIALDDFGTGYSSLAHLQNFPISVIKVDRSFVQGLGFKDEQTNIVQSIIQLAHSLNKIVVAEGVEESQQLEQLQQMGCDQVQGYLTGRPMPLEDVIKVAGKRIQINRES